jgi:hypothetical protein
VLACLVDLALGEDPLHDGHDVLLLVRQVHCEPGVDSVQGGEDGRGIPGTTAGAPPRLRVERLEVDQHLRVLLLHPAHVQGARRCPVIERVPQLVVLELVVRVEADRQHAEVVAHQVGTDVVAVGHPATSAGAPPNSTRYIRWISIMPLASQGPPRPPCPVCRASPVVVSSPMVAPPLHDVVLTVTRRPGGGL